MFYNDYYAFFNNNSFISFDSTQMCILLLKMNRDWRRLTKKFGHPFSSYYLLMFKDTVDANWMLYYSSNKIVHQSFYFYHKNKMINELVYLVISLFNYISSNNINIIIFVNRSGARCTLLWMTLSTKISLAKNDLSKNFHENDIVLLWDGRLTYFLSEIFLRAILSFMADITVKQTTCCIICLKYRLKRERYLISTNYCILFIMKW